MGLGGYLAARSDAEHYEERLREHREVRELPRHEEDEVAQIFASYGLNPEQIEPLVASLRERPEAWVDFMMRFELGLERPDPRRAFQSAFTIALAYIVGGLIPLAPYMILPAAHEALAVSALFTLFALLVFGYVKGRFTGARPLRSAVQTMLIGGAGAAFAIARLVS
jgi:VIT1/CCC1 family predicted Fe2+/Mn2+ transporter